MRISLLIVLFQLVLNLFLSISLMLLMCMFLNLHMLGIGIVIGLCLFNAVFHLFVYLTTLVELHKGE